MKKLFYLALVLLLIGCQNRQKPVDENLRSHGPKTSKPANNTPPEKVQYSDQQLEQFLDSVGHLPTQALADKVAFSADSIFKNQRHFDTIISQKDINTLKHAIRKGVISVKTASRIFKNPQIDSSCTEKSIFLDYKPGLTPIEYYPFQKTKGIVDDYAICIGDPDHCPNACLYFFRGNKIIEMHNFYERFAPGLWHYTDADGKTVIYYIYMFAEGSGEWWFNYFFYKYDGDKLIPVLNELQNGNVTAPVDRAFWLESSIQKTNPLTIKMVYHDEFPDTNTADFGPSIINDSTIVKYNWNEQLKIFEGDYKNSKISKPQILSYYLMNDNEHVYF